MRIRDRFTFFADSRLGALVLGLLLVGYAWLTFVVLSPDAMYAGDIGIKYVQAQSLVDHRFTSLDIPYRGAAVDPAHRFTPFRSPFVMPNRGGVQAIFAPPTAVFDGIFVAFFEYPGMVLASFLAACVIVWAAWRLTAIASAGLPIVLVCATPLWFYGTLGWEHAPAIAFSTLGFLVAFRSAGVWQSLAAGLLLGLGATIRDEVVLLAPGLLLGIWLRQRNLRVVLLAGIGVAVSLAVAGAVEVWWFHRPLAAHLLHAVHFLRSAAHLAAGPNEEMPALRPFTLYERYFTVIVYWLVGYGGWSLLLPLIPFTVALAIRWRWKQRLPLLGMLAALMVLASIETWPLMVAHRWVAGMYRLSPFLVFALLPSPERDDRTRLFRTTVVFTLLSYFLLAFWGADTDGGKSMGPRLMMPLVPLLAISAWQVIVQHLQARTGADRLIGLAGVWLLGCGLAIHLGATIPAYAGRNGDDAAAVKFLRGASAPIIVADNEATAQLLLPLYYDKIILLADSQPLADALALSLAENQYGQVQLVSRAAESRIELPGYRRFTRTPVGRMFLEDWRK